MIDPIQKGQPVPPASLHFLDEQRRLQAVTTAELFAPGKTVVVFGLPGAFTPTCSTAHVPRYEELAGALKAQGVDEIVCISVNDAFVMDAWAKDQGVEQVRFLADGNGELSRGLGLLVDKSALGFGARAWRFSMLVRDGKVAELFPEPVKPGDPYEVSDADTMLKALGGDPQPDIVLFTKPGCGHCARAKGMLKEAALSYEDIPASPRVLRALSATATTPRVFVDGELIGGADELAAWLSAR
ncbi:MAG: glutathione peroxidase [Myxococcales bacterium]|nr:glutathione peroxidase [Myxococcales bacterium]